jgi:hypothetical protein
MEAGGDDHPTTDAGGLVALSGMDTMIEAGMDKTIKAGINSEEALTLDNKAGGDLGPLSPTLETWSPSLIRTQLLKPYTIHNRL